MPSSFANVSRAEPFFWGFVAATLSPALELITGQPLLYNLVLTGCIVVPWIVYRFSRAELGLRGGSTGWHLRAAAYPVVVAGALAGAAWASGHVQLETQARAEPWIEFALIMVTTWIAVLISEDGFYRGVLWALGIRAGWSRRGTLLVTSAAFTAWHVAVPLIEPAFALPAWLVPVYLGNVMLLGLAWGLLRQISDSVLVACTAHAVWNACAYVLFGHGVRAGALGIERYDIFGPERGILGLLVNILVVVWLWRRMNRSGN